MTITTYRSGLSTSPLIHYSPDPKIKFDFSKLKDFIKFEFPPIESIKFELPTIEPIKFELPTIEPIKFEFPEIELIKISQIDHDTILLARPVHELIAHLKDFKIPSFVLIARVIKTLFLAVFRWHLCDHVLLKRENNLLLNKQIIHHLSEETLEVDELDFKLVHPYMLENAYLLKSKEDKQETHDFDYDDVSPDTLRAYFIKCYGTEITPKEIGNTINDLFKSAHLDLIK